MPHRAAIAVLRVMLLVTPLILVSCSKERPLQSPPTKYLLYVGMNERPPLFKSYVLVVDCATDSVVDSLGNDDYYNRQVWKLIASPDGKFLLLSLSTGGARIWDLENHTEVHNLGVFVTSAVFVPNAGALVVWQPDSALVYSIPDFTVTGKVPSAVGSGVAIPGTTRVITLRGRSHDPTDYDLLTYDMSTRSFVDSLRLQTSDLGNRVYMVKWIFAADVRRLYVLGADMTGPCAIGYDVKARSRLFRSATALVYCYPWLSAARDEVWVTYGATPFGGPWPTFISVFDAKLGSERAFIDPSASLTGWAGPMPNEVVFLPTGDKAYVQCGTEAVGPQPVLVIRTPSNEIERVLFDDRAHLPASIALGIDPHP